MVFDNLLSNANKYTPPGGKVVVTLKTEKRCAIVTVADNGVGIPKAERTGVFDKFTRGSSEMTSQVNGSGIGLYLVKRIVELHKGKIEVSDNKPEGTVFTLTLPIKVSHSRRDQ
jgi:two-component system sensor histidine kinase KdpD